MRQEKEAKEGKFEEISSNESSKKATQESDGSLYGYSVKLNTSANNEKKVSPIDVKAEQEAQQSKISADDVDRGPEAKGVQSTDQKVDEQQSQDMQKNTTQDQLQPQKTQSSQASSSSVTQEQMRKLQEALKNPNNAQQATSSPEIKLGNPGAAELPATNKTSRTAELAKTLSIASAMKVGKACLSAVDSFTNFIMKKDVGVSDTDEVMRKARSPVLFGMWVCIITFLIGGVWSGVAPLDSASGAMGFIVPSSKKQRVQNKEGGILEQIFVKEGQIVQAAQPLLRLSDKSIAPQLHALKIQKTSIESQHELIKDRVKAVEQLVAENYVQKRELISLQIEEARMLQLLSEVESKIISLEEMLQRATVTAPVTGVVNQIQVHTVGEVVHPGETLMTITPQDDSLVVEAYVPPDRINDVHIGLKARVMVTAFKHRSVAPLEGIVTYVSSDVVEPPSQHKMYGSQESQLLASQGLMFRVRIEIDPAQLKTISKYREYELQPGMHAQVNIVTGERTLLQYLMDPITTTFWHAFKEK